MYQTPTRWLPEDQTSEQERDRGRCCTTSEVQGGWGAKTPAIFTSWKGWGEGILEIFVHSWVLLCDVCESLLKISPFASDSGSCLSHLVLWWRPVICSRMLPAVCSALHKILIRHVPILKELQLTSFYLLFALTQISGRRLLLCLFFICLRQLIPVPTSNALQFWQILVVWHYNWVKSGYFTKSNSWICFTSNGITQTGATE